MIYSCFDEARGIYRYFEDSETRAFNGDLPTPALGSAAGQVGVPAREAGRQLPSGARRVGEGWQARGTVVSCAERQGMGSFEGSSSALGALLVAGVVVALAAWW